MEEAGALAKRIGKAIVRLWCITEHNVSNKSGVKDVWEAVQQLTGKKRITADSLNPHYASSWSLFRHVKIRLQPKTTSGRRSRFCTTCSTQLWHGWTSIKVFSSGCTSFLQTTYTPCQSLDLLVDSESKRTSAQYQTFTHLKHNWYFRSIYITLCCREQDWTISCWTVSLSGFLRAPSEQRPVKSISQVCCYAALVKFTQTSRPQLGVEACAGPFQVAKTRGDGYVLPRTRHPMMMIDLVGHGWGNDGENAKICPTNQ